MSRQQYIPPVEVISPLRPEQADRNHKHNDQKDDGDDETTPLLLPTSSHPHVTHVYKRRWYVLAIFSLLAFLQNCMWNTFGPISAPAERVFHWSNSEISLLANWGSIAYIPMLPIITLLLNKRGLSSVIRLGSFLLMVAATLRCISTQPFTGTLLMNVAQFINGLVGPVAMAVPPVLSSIWFPPHQRTLATAVGTQILNLGVATSFLLGPYVVPDIIPVLPANHTDHNVTTTPRPPAVGLLGDTQTGPESYQGGDDLKEEKLSSISLGRSQQEVLRTNKYLWGGDVTGNKVYDLDGKRVRMLMCIEASIATLLFLITCIYCPSNPPHPPSVSAGADRLDLRHGILSLIKSKVFWLIALAYGISNGVLNGWASNLDIILNSLHIGEVESGWVGFLMSIISSIVAIVVGCLINARYKKRVALVFCVLMTASFLLFLLIQQGVFHAAGGVFVASSVIIFGNTMCQCVIPLYYEMCVENTYPIPESLSSSALTLPNNLISIVFLLVPLLASPRIGTLWMTYCLVASCIISTVLTLAVHDVNQRLAIDDSENNDDEHLNINTSETDIREST